ncbi:M23 family metallopeptidase [Streptomyces subrutilus]|uniref:M23 family metallopeptidase n=1 Tax=Streptomyces subrutilus TaxID=36818 RepID=UPI002E140D68|nr:peptidoglycan DD-metalloendopeptidase family protein [Streptomyces subrutilus]
MNDRPPSGQYPDPGYEDLATTNFAGESPYVSYETQGQGVNYAPYGSYETGAYDTTAWTAQDPYLSTVPAQAHPEDTTGQWDASAWTTPGADYADPSGYQAAYPQQAVSFGYDTSGEQSGHWAMPGYGTTGTETGAYDATAWNTVAETPAPAPAQPEPAYAYEHQQHGYGEQQHQQTAHEQLPHQQTAHEQLPHQQTAHEQAPQQELSQTYAYGAPDGYGYDAPGHDTAAGTPYAEYSETAVFEVLTDEPGPVAPPLVHDMPTQAMPVTPAAPRASRRTAAKGKAAPKAASEPKAASAAGGAGRRRTPAKRSALLTVAVPSACVMGIAGVAAASVGGLTGSDQPSEDTTTMAAPDPASVKPVAANTKLDTQLAALSADAGDFADRASRTQERIDLRLRQDEEKKKKAEEAAAKEAARPKFAIPVARHGLSANFGQAGGMWMSVHTGIDFPVSYGTPVMAATDGTVRTQFNSAYGNMAIVTSPDGTETWYCHLSSTKLRGGKVKAGEVIAYSGDSGNSTGPHLHFEVRPGGGAAIDPLPWLRSHGLDPT